MPGSLSEAAKVADDWRLCKVVVQEGARLLRLQQVSHSEENRVFGAVWKLLRRPEAGTHSANAALSLFVKRRRFQWVPSLLFFMHQRSLKPDVATYTALLPLTTSTSEARSLQRTLHNAGLSEDSHFERAFVRTLFRYTPYEGSDHFAMKLKNELFPRADPPEKSFLFAAFLQREENGEKVLNLLDEYEGRGYPINDKVVSMALQGLREEDVVMVLRTISTRFGINMISTRSIAGAVAGARFADMQEVLLGMSVERKVPFDVQFCVACLQNCRRHVVSPGDEVEKLAILFERRVLMDSALSASPEVFALLMDIFAKTQNIRRADELMEHFSHRRGVLPQRMWRAYTSIASHDAQKWQHLTTLRRDLPKGRSPETYFG